MDRVSSLLRSIKYMALHNIELDPFDRGTTLEDLIRVAKFYLCHKCNRLLNDPIWDKYSKEDILIEYYSHRFALNEQEREKALADFDVNASKNAKDDRSFIDWAKNRNPVKDINFKPNED